MATVKKTRKLTTKSPAPNRTAKPTWGQAHNPVQVLLPIIECLAQSAERLAQAAEQMAETTRISAITRAEQQSNEGQGAEQPGEGAAAFIIDEEE
jgi:hypothetical protein